MDLNRLSRAAPAAARHVGAYLELAAEEASLLVGELKARLLAAIFGAAAAFLALTLAVIWIVVWSWDTAYRQLVVGLLFSAFAIAGGVALYYGLARPAGQRPFGRVRQAWRIDRSLLQAMFSRSGDDKEGAAPPREESDDLYVSRLRQGGI